jgi:hypothetical protein
MLIREPETSTSSKVTGNMSKTSDYRIIDKRLTTTSSLFFFSGTIEHEKEQALKKSRSIERSHYESSRYVSDEEDNIVFEDFARLRLSEAE